jgi:hypothetical protein
MITNGVQLQQIVRDTLYGCKISVFPSPRHYHSTSAQSRKHLVVTQFQAELAWAEQVKEFFNIIKKKLPMLLWAS